MSDAKTGLQLKTSNVDTWWLYDDGGLNILLPYVLTNRVVKEKLPLRIFALPKQNCKLEESQKSIETLLAMYRIDYSQLKLVNGLYDAPDEDSWALFESIVGHYKSKEQSECYVTEEELIKQHTKTSRYLRLREVVLENSSEAGMIVMSLPIPRRNAVSPPLYMAWLEMLSRDLPPMLFVRGNNTPVLGV
ncbi:unnamed protein product [Chilo suppressalis]|uniref:SLC12A transporter C-terminal domain-containing protein n=1 Tax=Chilo suppressalis TaxID=168631 RepID=A0ABN8AZ81_CHISP|nr:hypothetical protein evm_005440 [Chilo suppressalis]CAH0399420.1 unnamed protein product [Chilo suppressalis]